MKIKEKFIGILVIILGSLPFLLLISAIQDLFMQYPLLEFIKPGSLLYQITIIALGAWLIYDSKRRMRHA